MTERSSGTVEGTGTGTEEGAEDVLSLLPGAPHAEGHNKGRPISWVAVTLVIIGFVIGGIAFVPHPTWWAIWVGAGVAAVGFIFLAFTNAVNEDWY